LLEGVNASSIRLYAYIWHMAVMGDVGEWDYVK
jgi:hypothetical protein